jgi:hypothetical protein
LKQKRTYIKGIIAYVLKESKERGCLEVNVCVATGNDGSGGVTPSEVSLLLVAQVGVAVFLIVAIVGIVYLLIRTGVGARMLSQGEQSWLDYGNFFVVALGLAAVLIGFLAILLFANRFTDITQALGFLTALFGAITGLVGTYFGIKSSTDARAGAEVLAAAASGTTTPTVTLTPPTATQVISTAHIVTATVTSANGSPAADASVTFTVTAGPDTGITPQIIRTNAAGQASFTLTNNERHSGN